MNDPLWRLIKLDHIDSFYTTVHAGFFEIFVKYFATIGHICFVVVIVICLLP